MRTLNKCPNGLEQSALDADAYHMDLSIPALARIAMMPTSNVVLNAQFFVDNPALIAQQGEATLNEIEATLALHLHFIENGHRQGNKTPLCETLYAVQTEQVSRRFAAMFRASNT